METLQSFKQGRPRGSKNRAVKVEPAILQNLISILSGKDQPVWISSLNEKIDQLTNSINNK